MRISFDKDVTLYQVLLDRSYRDFLMNGVSSVYLIGEVEKVIPVSTARKLVRGLKKDYWRRVIYMERTELALGGLVSAIKLGGKDGKV